MTEDGCLSPQDTDALVVLTTTETEDEARLIAETAVHQRLAACVQIVGPISGVYRWKGSVESAREWLCVLKTRRTALARLEEAVRAVHSYDLPELVALPVTGASTDYLAWLLDQIEDSK